MQKGLNSPDGHIIPALRHYIYMVEMNFAKHSPLHADVQDSFLVSLEKINKKSTIVGSGLYNSAAWTISIMSRTWPQILSRFLAKKYFICSVPV